jgi:hypothetical protein
MGFTVMETFMDMLEVTSEKEYGTKVVMKKDLNHWVKVIGFWGRRKNLAYGL